MTKLGQTPFAGAIGSVVFRLLLGCFFLRGFRIFIAHGRNADVGLPRLRNVRFPAGVSRYALKYFTLASINLRKPRISER
jgi:hypothetical protein